jgi:hypothetical protein
MTQDQVTTEAATVDAFVDAAADLAYYIYCQFEDAAQRIRFVPGSRQPIAAAMYGLQTLAGGWNAANPIGTKVVVETPDGRRHAKTASQAWIVTSHGVAVYLRGSRGFHNLDHVRPLEVPNG